jgi:cytochrome c-type biogenesis protein CcmH
MVLWLALALMTSAAALAVLWPLMRRSAPLSAGSDIAVYRDQLEEVDRDRAAGLIDEQEASAARVEVSRRLIAAASLSREAGVEPASGPRRAVAVAVLTVLPLGAVGLYLLLGSPTLPDQPLAPRLAAARANPPIEALVAQVEAHLARNPDEGRGWEVIAPVYTRLGRFDDAVKARRNALRLNGEAAARVAALGEALVLAASGLVTAEAKALFERAVALDPAEVQARYFLGLAAEQEGDRATAAGIWRRMLAAAPADAPWVAFVRDALDRLEGGRPRGDPAVRVGPTEEQVAAASDLSPEQRQAMIGGMVERLAERLQRDGSDVEGWIRLIRAYLVLGERDKARAAAGDARRALADDVDKLGRLDDLVAGLGLKG